MQFSYKGRNNTGVVSEGIITAVDRAEAISLLRGTGVTPFAIKEKTNFGGKLNSLSFFGKVKLSEKIIFTKNISGMLKAGLTITRSLQVLSRQTKNKFFKGIIQDLVETIDKGETLSDGLAKHPKVFSSLFIAMVKAGEESGSLPQALTEVGVNLEKTYALNRKIKSAMMYPAIIICAIIIIAILMFMYVVPTLVKTFKELGTELPLSTKIVVAISDAVSNHILFVILGLVLVGAGIYFSFRIKRTKRMIDYLSTRLPVIGTLIQEVNAARTTRTLASLLTSGVSIGRAISITTEVLQNSYYKEAFAEVNKTVERGEAMSKVFKAHTELYPVMVGEMIEVGEETGKLSTMLLDIAVFYEAEVDAKTKDLSTIIEPVLMVFIGAGVGFFAISMLSPMYSIMDNIK
jgi:type IV pilus assembly protein PilC